MWFRRRTRSTANPPHNKFKFGEEEKTWTQKRPLWNQPFPVVLTKSKLEVKLQVKSDARADNEQLPDAAIDLMYEGFGLGFV